MRACSRPTRLTLVLIMGMVTLSIDAQEPEAAPAPTLTVSASPAHGTIPQSIVALLTKRVVQQSEQSEQALFAPHSWYVPPPPPPIESAPKSTTPEAPPVPYTYFGSYLRDGDTPLYFLVRQNRIYTVQPGDELEGTYHIDAVQNGRLLLTYKPLKIQQTIFVGGERP